ncbi:MAG: FkbM family methyltransferase [Candidatus Parvarchaeota archaeon]
MNLLGRVRKYKVTYKNWISVIYDLYKKTAEIEAVLRNGQIIKAPPDIIWFFAQLNYSQNSKYIECFSYDNGITTFPISGKTVKIKFFDNDIRNGEFASFLGDYNFLEPIEKSTVVDIGANICDSTIYFAIKGASKIIALEPFEFSYNWGLFNLKLNSLEGSRISLLNVGYGPDGFKEIENKISGVGSELKESKAGVKVRIISLKTLIDEYIDSKEGLLLKMDCEGCEYNLLCEANEVINNFKKILIEYHYGYERLKLKLEECGFDVKFTEPHIWKDGDRVLNQGYLYAVKK